MTSKLTYLIIVIGLGVLISGCAGKPEPFTLQVPPLQNPTAGPVVKIIEISDSRTFETAPRQPSIPSMHNVEDLKDPDLVARAVARFRGAFGRGMDNIFLPPDQTMVQVVRDVLENGLREAGYRVVKPGAPGSADAVALKANVPVNWGWFVPGVKAHFYHRIRVDLVGPWPLKDSQSEAARSVSGEAHYSHGWRIYYGPIRRAMIRSFDALIVDLKGKLKPTG